MKLKLRPKQAVLHLDNGTMIDVEWLGKGMFADCWTDGTSVYSIVHGYGDTMDYSKEILSHVSRDCMNPHIPSCQFLGNIGDSHVYVMAKFDLLRAKHREAWRQHKILSAAFNEAHRKIRVGEKWGDIFRWDGRCPEYNQIIVDLIRPQDLVLAEALQELADEACNYENYKFEFGKPNLKVGIITGTLKLIDVLCPVDAIEAFYNKKRRRV
jgi:hypothetical protein